ncbi:Uncharacterised protein [uncultured Clostridium sp.]|nr:Uncharacterised protein [uncultured Clostridium sp.]
MSENRDFDFCPRCGALMQDGVCRSCGYSGCFGGGQASYSGNGMGYGTRNMPRKKKTRGWVIALSILGAVLLLAALLIVTLNVNRLILNTAQNTLGNSGSSDYSDDYGDYYDDSDDYEPSADDPYYKEIVDTIDPDVSYTIDWLTESRFATATEDNTSYNVTYPELRDKEDGRSYDAINAAIKRAAEQYKDSYRSYPDGVTSSGYVTYMDEEKISVVFQHRLSEENGTLPRLTAVNFRIETGEQLAPSEMAEIDEELVMRFRAQDQTQNGGVDFVTNSSDEELLKLLSDPEEAAYFYSPVGLEAGFNYESEDYGKGWVSVTLKDYTL